jgi:hypothetical protein
MKNAILPVGISLAVIAYELVSARASRARVDRMLDRYPVDEALDERREQASP